MSVMSTSWLGALPSTPRCGSLLLPWSPHAPPGLLRTSAARHEALYSSAPARHGPARQRRPGGGTPPAGMRLRKRGPAAARAAPGPADVNSREEVVLLDLLLPPSPPAVALTLFDADATNHSGSSGGTPAAAPPHGLLVHHMQQSLGHLSMAAERWRPAGSGGDLRRQLTYDTTLSRSQRLLLPFGPAAVRNAEEQQLTEDGSGGLRLVSTVTSEGVPFADCFTNRLVWRLQPLGGRCTAEQAGGGSSRSSGAARSAALAPYTAGGSDHGTRLLLTARCVFHKRVIGPLRGQIEEQSLQASVRHRRW